MKAQVLQSWGGRLTLVDRPRPAPQAGEVLVAVRACGVGLTVLNYMSGQLGRPETLPRVPGHEITGVVAEVGRDVTAVRAGDRVMTFFYLTCGRCEFCRAGRDALCRDPRGSLGRTRRRGRTPPAPQAGRAESVPDIGKGDVDDEQIQAGQKRRGGHHQQRPEDQNVPGHSRSRTGTRLRCGLRNRRI